MLSADSLYFSLPLNISLKGCCVSAEHEVLPRTNTVHTGLIEGLHFRHTKMPLVLHGAELDWEKMTAWLWIDGSE